MGAWVQGTNSSPIENSAKSTKFGTPQQATEVSEASQTKNNPLYDLSDPVLFSNFSGLADQIFNIHTKQNHPPKK